MLKLAPYRYLFFCQVALGAYLCFHFLRSFPSSEAIYSLSGMKVMGGELYFKGGLNWLRSSWGIYVLHAIGLSSALCLIFNWHRRSATLTLAAIWTFLFHQNILTYHPGLPYIGWLLLALAFIPKDKEASFPVILLTGMWIIFGLSYSSSGIHKLVDSPLWREGRALDFILNGPLVRFVWISETYMALPEFLRRAVTLSVAVGESLAFFLIFFKLTRKVLWHFLMALHLGILFSLEMTDVSLSMLAVQLFLVEKGWFAFGGIGDVTFYSRSKDMCPVVRT